MSTSSLPTESQMLSLARLVPSQPTPFPQLDRLLSPIFPLFSTDWVSAFLLTNEPLHIHLLTSAELFSNSLAFHLNVTRSPGRLLDIWQAGCRGHHYDNAMLFVPAFTVSSITVGVGVLQTTEHVVPAWIPEHILPPQNNMLNFRFVLDATQDLLVILYDVPQEDSVLLFYSHLLSTCHSCSFAGLFRRSELHENLKEQRYGVNLGCFASALIFFQEEDEWRQCALCGAGGQSGCGCKFETVDNLHPLSKRQVREGLSRHVGEYHTVVNRLTYVEGSRGCHEVLGCRVMFRGVEDAELVRRLSSWSMGEFVKGRGENMSPMVSVRGYGLDLGLSGFGEDGADLWFAKGKGGGRKRIVGEFIIPIAEEPCETTLELPMLVGQRGITSSSVERGVDADSISARLQGSHQKRGNGSGGPWLLAAPLKPSPSNFDMQTRKDISCIILAPTNFAADQTETWTAAKQRLQDSSRAADAKARADAAARRERASRRRERNRMSARISNMKRKRRLDAMVDDLRKCHEKVGVLREREMALRSENQMLRQQVRTQVAS